MPRKQPLSVDDDILWGAKEIGAEIRRSEAQVYYLHEKKLIPTRKVGHRLITASRRQLRRHLAGDSQEID
jgi:hypothetical protein